MMGIYYINHPDHDYVAHSSGPWKKHKYIKKVGNDYIYSEEDQKHLDEKADEVIKGKYKNGEERRKALESEGESYEAIQNVVNKRLGNNYRYEIKQDDASSDSKDSKDSKDQKKSEEKKEKEIPTSNPSLVGSGKSKYEIKSGNGGYKYKVSASDSKKSSKTSDTKHKAKASTKSKKSKKKSKKSSGNTSRKSVLEFISNWFDTLFY